MGQIKSRQLKNRQIKSRQLKNGQIKNLKSGVILKVINNGYDVDYYCIESRYIPILDYINRNIYYFEGQSFWSPSHRNKIPDDIYKFIWTFRSGTCNEVGIKIGHSTIEESGSPRNYEISIQDL